MMRSPGVMSTQPLRSCAPTLGQPTSLTESLLNTSSGRIKPMLQSMRRGLWKSLLILSLSFGTSAAWAQGGLIGPPNQILCNKTAQLSPTSINSIYTAVQGVTGKNIYVCGWHITTATSGAAFFQFFVATGTTSQQCAAGTAGSLTPSLSVSGTAPSADHIDYATMQTSATGQALCVGIQNGVNESGVVYYSQF